MPTFNPYHFIPAKAERHDGDLEKSRFLMGDHHVRHDKYCKETFSGRIVCRLTTQSPIFVGGVRSREGAIERPAESTHFELPDKPGLPAIPASTLRGVISSLSEAAANSTLRVLADEMYSFRKQRNPDEALSAIGMVIVENNNGNVVYKLRPLTLPTIKTKPGKDVEITDVNLKELFPVPNLKVYIGNSYSIRRADFYRTYRDDAPEYYGLQLTRREWNQNFGIDFDTAQHRKNTKNNVSFLLGQKAKSNEAPMKWDKINKTDRETIYTRGIIRTLGCWGERNDKIPENKTHEIFIPYPENEAEYWPLFEITPLAVERFHDLSDQRTRARTGENDEPVLPFEPKDTIRNLRPIDKNDRRFRLKTGDLVYFKHTGNKITEISLSSIWRGRVEKSGQRATTHDFFKSITQGPGKINQELLPFHPDRQWITLAEQIYGFVQQSKKDSNTDSTTNCNDYDEYLALAGRVWFSHALIKKYEGDSAYLESVTLKILDTPKPPSPSLYFFKSKGKPAYIPKRELQPGSCTPQGRKFYLHDRSALIGQKPSQPWKSHKQWTMDDPSKKDDRFKQKVQITPVKAHSVFYFHVDFVNLSRLDLGMLLFALQPSPEFRHKIGMGKSIGLGTVKIEPVGFFNIDRASRYTSDGLFSQRYQQYWKKNREDWPDLYQKLKGTIEFADLESVKNEFANSIDPDILNAMKLIGEKDYQPVQTPLIEGGTMEEETFKWFVMNERGNDGEENASDVVQQFLKPLTATSVKIEPFQKHPFYPKQ